MKGSEALGFTSCLAAAPVTTAADAKSGEENRRSAERELKVCMLWTRWTETECNQVVMSCGIRGQRTDEGLYEYVES